MPDDGLVDLTVVDHDVRISDSTGRDKVDGVATQVGVRE